MTTGAQHFYENNKSIPKFHPSDEQQVFAFAEAYAALREKLDYCSKHHMEAGD